MYRILSIALVVGLVVVAGCANTDNKGKSGYTGSSSDSGRSSWMGGSDYNTNQWGSGFSAMTDSSTTNVQVLQACHDLRDAKMAVNRINAARRLAELRPTSNIAIEALEDGCKDEVNDVRMASAMALQSIGTDSAMHHLKEAQDKGLVPSGTINWSPTGVNTAPSSGSSYQGGSPFQGEINQPNRSTETKVEVRTDTSR